MSQDEAGTSSVGMKVTRQSTPWRIVLIALLAVAAVSTAGLVMARLQSPDRQPARENADPPAVPAELKDFAAKYFPSWQAGNKPDLIILMTGEQHNYEQPCGCTEPQLGGLERRYNFVKKLRGLGLNLVPVDLGDIYFNHYEPGKPTQLDQIKLKYKLSMNALSQMGYEAICVGKEEFRIPLLEGLGETVLNSKPPYAMLAANIKDRATNFPGSEGPMIGDFKVTNTPIKLGIIGVIGQSVIDEVAKIDKEVKFESNATVIPATVQAMNLQKPDVRMLLYHGRLDEAKLLAAKITEFDIILCLSSGPEPPGEPADVVGKTRIIQVGHKGRFVGAMAVFRKADGSLDYHYHLVPMSGEFKTPSEERATNAGLKQLEDYTKEVRDQDLLSRYPQVKHALQVQFSPNAADDKLQPRYVGSKRCQECHDKEYQVWDGSKHAEAFETLVNNKKPPGNRQFDGECVVCHTVGFGYVSGYRDEKKTPNLKGVGCENCHGPGSLHADKPKNKELQLAMSPWKRNPTDDIADKSIQKVIFQACFHCHDTDNDHDFSLERNWPKIGHGKNANQFKK